MSKTAASEWSPGVTETPQTAPWLDSIPGERERAAGWNALRRPAQPEAAARLLSDRASFVTGVELAVDGGHTAIAPHAG